MPYPNQEVDNNVSPDQKKDNDMNPSQGKDNERNPNQYEDYDQGEDKEDMNDETTSDLQEDGNDRVIPMKPLATLKKHTAVHEKAHLAYR